MSSVYLCSPSMVMGGAERYLLNLSEGLIEEDNDVTILLMEAKGPLLNEIDDRCRVISVNRPRAIKSVRTLMQVFNQNSPDIVISFQTHMNVIVLIAMILAKNKAPIIITEHAPISNHLNTNIPRLTRIKNRVMLAAAKQIYKRAYRLVGVSGGVTQEYMDFVGLPANRVKTISTPVVTPKLLLKAGQAPTHQWIAGKEHPIIVSMGRLEKIKDHITLIGAFDRLRDRLDARLVIFGEGAERAKLEQLIRDRNIEQFVDLPGIEMNPFREMAHADLYVQTSISEGFGNVLVEAMACGLPVISTDCPTGPREILLFGKYGALTPVGDEAALAEKMYQILSVSEDEKEKIISAGKLRANEFSLEQSVKYYIEMF